MFINIRMFNGVYGINIRIQPTKHTIETAAETPGVLCTTFDGRMQLWDIGWSLRSWIEIDYGDW